MTGDDSFNTSHVTLYPRQASASLKITIVSIHLMLLFIFLRCEQRDYFFKVSIHLMLLFIPFFDRIRSTDFCFNTSHVTLYQDAHNRATRKYEFQYISCYSLSSAPSYVYICFLCFNTSHVTLYLFYARILYIYTVVSIHLMLLFISHENWELVEVY